MKTLPRLILALAMFAIGALSAKASFFFSRVAPDDLLVGGYAFDIKADKLKDGNVQFRVLVSADDENRLNDNGVNSSVSLDNVKETPDPFPVQSVRSLTAVRDGKSLSCTFVVPETSLDTTDLCFVFYRATTGMPAANGFYASLRDLYKPATAAPSPARLEREKLKAAAEAGDSKAQLILGVRYWNGDGLTKDLAQAYKWFSLSSAQGNADAEKARAEIAVKVTSGQIAEGERLAREFKPTKTDPAGASTSGVQKKN